MSAHTPGPWIAEGYRIWGPPDSRSKHRSGRGLVGGVVDDHHDWRDDHDWRDEPSQTRDERSAFRAETAANARLIAAAPEMAAILRRVAEHRTALHVDHAYLTACFVCDARALLARIDRP